jgi:ubiquinone biosynthesis protein
LSKYAALAQLFTRYGRRDFRFSGAKGFEDDVDPAPEIAARATEFAARLEALGPTFVKFGQLLSTRPNLLPPEYITALERLQDHVAPFPSEQVEEIVAAELGVRISKAFADFDRRPLAAASIGQVHRATLRDGRQVVVKVQRPDIRRTIAEDLEMFRDLTAFLEKRSEVARRLELRRVVGQWGQQLLLELDYRQEARNAATIAQILAEFEEISVPVVVEDYTRARVLTMEFVGGSKVEQLSPVARLDHDFSRLAEVLLRAYLKQICVAGVWHSDPHSGNVFLSEGRLVLLDFGLVTRIGRDFQDRILRLLLAISDNRGREAAEVAMEIGTAGQAFSRDLFLRDVSGMAAHFHGGDLREVNSGRLFFNLLSTANGNDLRLPSELAMLGKTLLHLDKLSRALAPSLSPAAVIRDYAESLIWHKVAQKLTPSHLYAPLLDLHGLALELPRRGRDFLDQAVGGRLLLNHRLVQADDLLRGLHRIANRISVGVVLAAIVIGSAMTLEVPTRWRWAGYPALSILGFLIAGAVSLYLVLSTLWDDRRDRRRARVKSERS